MRTMEIRRKTNETDIQLKINLDGSGRCRIKTGIGFFDHMLTLFGFFAGFNLDIKVKGDLTVDDHHTVEDVGIVLGKAIGKIVGNKKGIARYGFFILPMDDVLARSVVDISGRSYLRFQSQINRPQIGEFATENIEQFFHAFVREAGLNLHLEILTGGNTHHQAEALFKCCGRSLGEALKKTGFDKIPSVKGKLD